MPAASWASAPCPALACVKSWVSSPKATDWFGMEVESCLPAERRPSQSPAPWVAPLFSPGHSAGLPCTEYIHQPPTISELPGMRCAADTFPRVGSGWMGTRDAGTSTRAAASLAAHRLLLQDWVCLHFRDRQDTLSVSSTALF